MSSDVLSAVVLKSNLDTHKHMHLVCKQWTTSVRCNLHTMQPSVLSTEQLKLYFPALRHLFLHKVTFAQNSTLCLATVRHLQTLSLKSCTFDQCESVAELAALSGILDKPIGRHCYCSATYGWLQLCCACKSYCTWCSNALQHKVKQFCQLSQKLPALIKLQYAILYAHCDVAHVADLNVCRSHMLRAGHLDRPHITAV